MGEGEDTVGILCAGFQKSLSMTRLRKSDDDDDERIRLYIIKRISW